MKLQLIDGDLEKGDYDISMICINCGAEDSYYLEEGKPITNEILKEAECVYCKCKGYLRKNFRVANINHPSQTNNTNSSIDNNDSFSSGVVGFGLGLLFD